MEIEILAAESLGVRSMACLVRTSEASILIDPGAALGPKRFGLPPDRIEWQRLKELKEKIRQKLKESEIVVITHYHYDHYDPEWAKEFKGKRLFLKDPSHNINRNQAKRAKEFLKRLSAAGVLWEVAEEKRLLLGRTEIRFSPPLNHGPEKRFGAVVSVLVREDGFGFLHSSDLSGPVQEEALAFIREAAPQVLFVDGPATYLGPRYGLPFLEIAQKALKDLVRDVAPKSLIIDHHTLRDLKWKDWAQPIFEVAAGRGVEVLCAAEFMKKPPLLLEALRKDRYKALKRSKIKTQ